MIVYSELEASEYDTIPIAGSFINLIPIHYAGHGQQ